jgi:hypothetical protein
MSDEQNSPAPEEAPPATAEADEPTVDAPAEAEPTADEAPAAADEAPAAEAEPEPQVNPDAEIVCARWPRKWKGNPVRADCGEVWLQALFCRRLAEGRGC